MSDVLGALDDYAGWIVAVSAGLTTLVVGGRWIRKRFQRFSHKWDSAREALVGREEIRHPDTGAVLVKATPGLGQRLAHIEENLTVLSDTRSEMQALTARVDSIASSLEQHTMESAEVWQARAQAESKMWDTIKTIAEAPPAQWDGTERRHDDGDDTGVRPGVHA